MMLEKDILKGVFAQKGVTIEDYPAGIYVYWRDGFNIAVNYTSGNYTVNIPEKAKIVVGQKTIPPAGVVIWTE
jgi:beta-galactosidase